MDTISWVMVVHVVTLGGWSAALLILAGLYAYPPESGDRADIERHGVMCRYVFVIVGSPAAVLAIISGSALVALLGVKGSWLLAKLAFVSLLGAYHAYCGHLLHKLGMETHGKPSLLRAPLLMAVPVALISAILVLVLAKPDVVFEYQLAPQPAGHRHQGGAQNGKVQATSIYDIERVFNPG